MRIVRRSLWALAILLPVLTLVAWALVPARATWFELTDTGTGRRIAARLLPDGESVVLTWTNSLFGLTVTEVFVAGGGLLTLTQITFADPRGGDPPRVRPEDVDDLYHTGGPFAATGLSRPIRQVIFRMGEIGDPAFRIGTESVRLVREVGIGGAVRLVARPARLAERILGRFRQP
jgi:hypothetical protein